MVAAEPRPGRCAGAERVGVTEGDVSAVTVLVDYARTPDGLEQALTAARASHLGG